MQPPPSAPGPPPPNQRNFIPRPQSLEKPNPATVTPSRPPNNASSAAIPPPRPTPPVVQSRNNNHDPTLQSGSGAVQSARRELGGNTNTNTINNNPNPNQSVPNGHHQPGGNTGAGAGAAFFSARAVDVLRDNPSAAQAAPQFDPHAESPSIRKTAGFDHSKSIPIKKPMLSGNGGGGGTSSPAATAAAPNLPRDYVNPSMDMHRKIGAPVGSGISGGGGIGPSTSSYRPLTRPNIDPSRNRITPSNNTAGSGVVQQNNTPNSNSNNMNDINNNNLGKRRPPLSDMSNPNIIPSLGSNDPQKRMKQV